MILAVRASLSSSLSPLLPSTPFDLSSAIPVLPSFRFAENRSVPTGNREGSFFGGFDLFTDTLKSYEGLDVVQHELIDNAVSYIEGEIHTNAWRRSGRY
jgi:hypothetical protein